ncbi:helicase HerA-like domain-containing protein [Sphingopyxis solisilvae]|uniref:helicase HerA-like domain-containing protein n=1 Tax=Sphingopyxis solisilvae TaxID=1886788 RepID=UPI001892BBB2|nr:helicase HerA-like domain-containing protein [Sphingopyxis solisilvae]
MASEIYIGLGGGGAPDGPRQSLVLKRANRHGLIAGATGTGKTVTLQGLAEGFSAVGVPVFVADVKGDLAGMAMAGSPTSKLHEIFGARAAEIGDTEWAYRDNPVMFWDLFGEQGHPVRTTISEMGPLLLARLMGLNEVQEGVLAIAFRVADEQNLLLLDMGDLQAMLTWCAENAAELTTKYGNVTKATVGTIQRQLLTLESQGGRNFFGEPALDIMDMIRCDDQGRGYINILAADKLMASPKLYATFLLWLLSEMFETLPEIGDPDKPKLVFFFDEAHLLFDDAPPALTDKIEQVVRLIRSKGIGVYFVTQNPIDVPDKVAGQLGNRVQHALRAFTPRDQRAVKAAAETFRPNPKVDVAREITELKVGEALVSLLMPDGAPSPVERTLIKPPYSRAGPLDAKERAIIRSISPVDDKYDTPVNRESAEELLAAKAEQAQAAAIEAKAQAEADKQAAIAAKEEAKRKAAEERERVRLDKAAAREAARPSFAEQMAQSAARSAATSLGRQVAGKFGGQLMRGILGGLFK